MHYRRTVGGVLKDLTASAIAYNLVRRAMAEAGRRQGVAVERVSLLDPMRWLASARPDDFVPTSTVNPVRSGRVEPQTSKHRTKHIFTIFINKIFASAFLLSIKFAQIHSPPSPFHSLSPLLSR